MSQDGFELHVKEVGKRGIQMKKEILKINYQTLILKEIRYLKN